VYQFARFNRKAQVITYTDEEFKQVIHPVDKQKQSDWTRLESDVLMDLCERFQIRFIVIADRFSNEV
jgi:DNA methyltransferase 1-associated protein 1